MRQTKLSVSVVILALWCLWACKPGRSIDKSAISSEPATVAQGESLFVKQCSNCHNFKHGSFGPQLGGITDSVSSGWITDFIRDPIKMIGVGDQRARNLVKKYKAIMPSFSDLTEDELTRILAFINVHPYPDQKSGLADPIPDSIRHSNLVAGVEFVTQIPSSADPNELPLARITKLDFQPGTGDVFVLDLRGKLYRLKEKKQTVYLDMTKLRPRFIHKAGLGTGFGSFAFHPDFKSNGLLYTTHAEAPGSGKADFSYNDSIKVTMQWVLTEWKADNPLASAFSGTSREILRENVMSVMHGIQEITFNPLSKSGTPDRGKLYVGVADGGTVAEGYPFLTHNLENIWGTILRIDPLARNSSNGKYGIPPDNPFVHGENPNARGEIYAYGFKNPHRITWTQSGQMLVSNIGQEFIESINLILPGHDYGWPVREGTFVLDPYSDLKSIYALPSDDSIYSFTYPVVQYDHEGGWTAISGGYEYTGEAVAQLKGKFLFGDIPSGRLFYINVADLRLGSQAPVYEWNITSNGRLTKLTELCKNPRVELRLGHDAKGEIYLLTKMDGKIYKLK